MYDGNFICRASFASLAQHSRHDVSVRVRGVHFGHVSGGLMVHMTGMVAFVHAYYLYGLRHADGWVGYGAKIHSARFRALAPPGEPMHLECKATQARRTPTSVFARYSFRFTHGKTLVYEGDQSALWTRVDVAATEGNRAIPSVPPGA
jgi:hypothetical protein